MHAYNKFWHANWIYPYNKLDYLFDEAENRKSTQKQIIVSGKI